MDSNACTDQASNCCGGRIVGRAKAVERFVASQIDRLVRGLLRRYTQEQGVSVTGVTIKREHI